MDAGKYECTGNKFSDHLACYSSNYPLIFIYKSCPVSIFLSPPPFFQLCVPLKPYLVNFLLYMTIPGVVCPCERQLEIINFLSWLFVIGTTWLENLYMMEFVTCELRNFRAPVFLIMCTEGR
jgi:hypothetical protein